VTKTFRSHCEPHIQNIPSLRTKEFLLYSTEFYLTAHVTIHNCLLFYMIFLHVSASMGHLKVSQLQRNICILLQMTSLKMVLRAETCGRSVRSSKYLCLLMHLIGLNTV